MQRRENIVSLDSLTTEGQRADGDGSDAHRLLDAADLVYAVHGAHERDILVFGKDKLRRIAESEVPEGARVVRVQLRSGTQELQRLLELVRQRKGRHDYAESA